MNNNLKCRAHMHARRALAFAMSLILAVAFMPAAGLAAQPAAAHADTTQQEGQVAVTLVGNDGQFSVWDETSSQWQTQDQIIEYVWPGQDSWTTMPMRDGYTFIGWKTAVDAEEVAFECDFENMACYVNVAQATTLYAVWEPREVEVMLDANGGYFDFDTTAKTKSVQASKRQQNSIGMLSEPSRDGDWCFAGWSEDPDATAADFSDSFTARPGMTLYAVWKQRQHAKLVLHVNDADRKIAAAINASDFAPSDYAAQVELDVIVDATNYIDISTLTDEYEIVGWSTDPQASESDEGISCWNNSLQYAPDSTAEVHLYAIWKATPRVTLTLDANGGKFQNWSEEKDKYVESNTDTVRALKDEEDCLYANPVRDGYRLLGWSESSGAAVPMYPVDEYSEWTMTASGDMTLYAVWAKREFVNLTLRCEGAEFTASNTTFDSEASSVDGVAVLQVAKGESNCINITRDVKYQISDWTSGDETYTAGGFRIVPEGDITLTATAEEVETITFILDGNGGSVSISEWDSVDQVSCEKVKEAEIYRIDGTFVAKRDYDPKTRQSYEFLGWSRAKADPSPTAKAEYPRASSAIEMPASDFSEAASPVYLYAVWRSTDCWNVTLDAGDGFFEEYTSDDEYELVKSRADYVAKGQDYQTYAESWEGHKLLGWSKTEDAGADGVDYPAPASEEGAWPVVENIDGDITLYAVWDNVEPIPHIDLTLDANGGYLVDEYEGIGEGEQTVTWAVELGKKKYFETTAKRDGYVFKGWSTTKDGAVEYEPDADGDYCVSAGDEAGSLTLYAVWEKENTPGSDTPGKQAEPTATNPGGAQGQQTAAGQDAGAGQQDSAPELKAGDTATVGGQQVKVTSDGTVQFTRSANKKSVTVPDEVTLADGKSYEVTSVGAKAFSGKKVRTVTIGRNVARLAKSAFKGSKATKVVVRTKKLKKASVKGCFAGSKVKTVQVKVGSKKANKAQAKKYKKVFTKKATGTKAKKLSVK